MWFPSEYVIDTNADGANPSAGLVFDGKSLYGVAGDGGDFGSGVVFKINSDGNNFTNLHNFTVTTGATFTNGDGSTPKSSLLLVSNNVLYGTTYVGGTFGYGTMFALNTDGTGFTNLYNFNGGRPLGSLILVDDALYGATGDGGLSGSGALFRINRDGSNFTNFYSFTANISSNSDGAIPTGGLISSSNILYGTAIAGGSWGLGTIFSINIDGSDFTNLYSFAGGNDGGAPMLSLISSGSILYGTTYSGKGGIYAIGIKGMGFTNLYSFTGGGDGANPYDQLVLSDTTLYGTTAGGTTVSNGTVFAICTNGTGFKVIHTFTSLNSQTNSDGAQSRAALIKVGNFLYGTAFLGGDFGNGTIFSVTLPWPKLTISSFGTNVVLTWPTNATGFTLQSTTNITSASSWITINAQNTVTNPISSTQQFYRLIQ